MVYLILLIFNLISLPVLADNMVAFQNAVEILEKAQSSMGDIKTVKLRSKIITGGVDVTSGEGMIDYFKGEYYFMEKKSFRVLRTFYFKNNTTYLYDGISNAWFSFESQPGIFENMLDRDKIFFFFPGNSEEQGFVLTLTGEENLAGKECYCLTRTISDIEKAKKFMRNFPDWFFPAVIAKELVRDEPMLEDYLNSYIQNFQIKQWIEKDTFLILKQNLTYRQLTGPDSSLSIQKETALYDFNTPVDIILPLSAQRAEAVSLEELNLNR